MVDSPKKAKAKQLSIVAVVFGGVIGLLILGMWLSDPNRGKATPMELAQQAAKEHTSDYTAKPSGIVSDEETWIVRSEEELERLRRENDTLESRLAKLEQKLSSKDSEEEESDGPTASPMDDPIPGFSGSSGMLPPPPKKSEAPLEDAISTPVTPRASGSLPPRPGGPRQQEGEQGQAMQVVDLSPDDESSQAEQGTIKHADSYFPTGAFGTAILLSGLDAPTGGAAKTQPVPVLMRLMDAGQLPNYFKSDVANCHIVGAGHGDIASERVHIRLETITCVLSDGKIIEEKISGWVSGEDGKAGMRGKLISKEGALLAKSFLAGFPAGLGKSLSLQNRSVSQSALGSVQTLDPDKAVEDGFTSGASSAMEKLADYYMSRANEIYPIIEVDANRIGEVILNKGTDFGETLVGNTRRQP